MSDLGKSSTNKSIHHGFSRIFMRSVKDLGRSTKVGPASASSNIPKSSCETLSSKKAPDDSSKEVEVKEKTDATHGEKRGRNLNERNADKSKIACKITDRRKSVVKSTGGTGRLSGRGKPHNAGSHIKSYAGSRSASHDEKCHAPRSLAVSDSKGNEKHDKNKVIVQALGEDWSLEIVDNYKDITDAVNEHTDKELLKDSGCVSDFNNNRSSFKLFGSLSSNGSTEVFDADCGKNSESDFLDVWKEGNGDNTEDNQVNSADKDLVGCVSSDTKLCSEELTDGGNKHLPFHSTPKKHRPEEIFVTLEENKDAVSPMDGNSVMSKGRNELEMSNPRHTGYKEAKHTGRFSTKQRGGDSYFKSNGRHYGNYPRRDDRDLPPRFRIREKGEMENSQHSHSDYSKEEKYFTNQRFVKGRDTFSVSQQVSGYQSSRPNLPGQSSWRKEENEGTPQANPLMDLQIKTPKNYKKKQPEMCAEGSKVNKIKWTLPVSEDWLSEIQEIETNDGQNNLVRSHSRQNDGSGIQVYGNENSCRSVGSADKGIVSTLPSNSTEEYQELLEDLEYEGNTETNMNIKPYIPPLPPGFDNDDVKIAEQTEGYDTVNTSEQLDEEKVMEEKAPYLPPIPDEIQQKHDDFDEIGDQSHVEGALNVIDNLKIIDTVTVDEEPSSLVTSYKDNTCSDMNVPSIGIEETFEKIIQESGADHGLAPFEHELFAKEPEQMCANQNVPLNADLKKWKGIDVLMTVNEDSSSVSSIVKTEDPCAYSVFGSTSEADVSDCCLDDSKILENVASQSSDGELIQGVKNFENEIMESGVRQSSIDHSSSCQFHSPSYEQHARYWYEQQLADPAYLGSDKFQRKQSDYFPYGYEAYGQWCQNMWYEQMRYRWEMYYRQYSDSSCSPDYDVYNQYHADNKYQYKNLPNRPRKCTQGDDESSKNTGSVNSCGHFAVNATETKKLVETATTPITASGKVEGSKSCSGSVDIGKEDISGDSPYNSGPKLSKYWSNRMERWVQRQHSIAKEYQGSHIPVDNKSDNGMVPPSIREEDSSKFSARQTNAVGGASLSSENLDAVVEESAMPEDIKPETDIKKARSSSDVKRGQSKEGVNTDSGTRSDSQDCSCKALDVLYIVWRTCKCSAGNPPKVHQILPCNHDDRSLDLGYQSYESLEHDETLGKVARNAARAPGFLIQPLNKCGTNKKDLSEKSESTGTADEGNPGTRNAKLLSDQDRLQPPPGFACPYTALSRNKEMDNSEAKVDKTEINNNTMPLKSRQPLTLKELIKQQNLLELSVGSYSPSDAENVDKNDNYSDMPNCLTASAAHLDEAVKSMGSAEEMEKSLVNALRVVNKRILDIQKNMNEQNKSDEINSDKNERSGSVTVEMLKADSKQVLDLENGNVECLGNMPSKVVGMNMKEIPLPSSTSSFYEQYDQQRSFGLNKKHVDVDKFYKTDETERRKTNLPGSDKKLNYSPEDETMTPPFEIPENEMMETESTDKMRMSDSDNNPKRIPPSPFSSLPLQYRFPFRPPPFYHPRMEHLNGAPMRPTPLPMPYQWPAPPFMCDPALMHNPWSDLDLRSRPVGPYFEKYSFADGHPRPRLGCSNMSEGPEGCKQKDEGNMKAPELRPQQKTCGLKCALKLIESYDTSDDDNNDDSPDIRPFDIKSIEDIPKFEEQKKIEVEKPTHKKLKKDKGYDWSPEYSEGAVGEMDTPNTSIKQNRSRKLKQKSLKTFKSTDRSATINSVTSDPICKTDVTKQVIKKKTLADIISEGRINDGERLSSRDDNELSPFNDRAEKKLPDFPPLPPFPNSPFWCMYASEKTSALSGHSPVETSSERSRFGRLQPRRKSHDSPFHRHSVSPGSGLYSPSETDSEKTSTRSDWKKNFKLFHNFGVKYIDTHCHLDFLFNRENFKGTFQAYMDKHSETFPDVFEGCVAVFCNPSSFNPKVGLWLEVAKESNVWIAMGCHPKSATDFTAAAEYGLEKCMRHTKCIALGEIGLDYSGTFRRHEEVQKRVFRCQLKMAVHLGKPLVIHSRDAEDDCIEILKEIVPRHWKIHCHCFTNAYSNATLWMDEFPNLFIGVTPLVTYRSATPTHDLARKIPLDKLLLETDAPYFIPRCIPREDLSLSNPGLAITVAKEIAKYQDVPVARVLRQCRLNTKAMYGI